MKRVTTPLAALAVGVLLFSQTPIARADDITVAGPMAMTGLAADVNRDVFWGTTDAHVAELVALNQTGKVAYKLSLKTSVTDVQAVSVRGSAVYLGDIGDPQGQRSDIAVLQVSSPRATTPGVVEYRFTYPDGAHDAGAFTVSPKGNFYVITRGAHPGVYRPAKTPVDGQDVPLRRVADAPADVSDATFLPDGARIALRVPTGVRVLDAYSFDEVASAPLPAGAGLGEALTTGLDGNDLMVGQGGTKPTIRSMSVPTELVALPTATPSASASATRKASAPVKASSDPSATSTKAPSVLSQQSKSTWGVIGGAAVVAVLAGLATLVGRRPEPGDHSADGDA